MPTFDQLEQLVHSFQRDIGLAKALESPNAQDDLAIKAAIVGFSYNSATDDWDRGHYQFVRIRLDRDYHDEELSHYGPNAENVRLFFALGLGYLLGLYQQGKIDDDEFKVAELQIPGLIMYHLPKLTAAAV